GRLVVGRRFRKLEQFHIQGMAGEMTIHREGSTLSVLVKEQGLQRNLSFNEDQCFAGQIAFFLASLTNQEVREQELRRHLQNMDCLKSMYEGVKKTEICDFYNSALIKDLEGNSL